LITYLQFNNKEENTTAIQGLAHKYRLSGIRCTISDLLFASSASPGPEYRCHTNPQRVLVTLTRRQQKKE